MKNTTADILGLAMQDYLEKGSAADIKINSTITQDDDMPVAHFFRTYEQMPKLEKIALQHSFGRILDVGCGAGAHIKHLQDKGYDTMGIDYSSGAIEVCKQRAINNVHTTSLIDLKNEKFDTILLLMNGTGIFQKLEYVDLYLSKLKSLLNPQGQILIDSSDIIYMFEEDDGSILIDSSSYYGEVTFYTQYKNHKAPAFDWLYMHYELLAQFATKHNLVCELLYEGEHFDYLAKLTLNN